jgi:glycosyltransferase involved in cell wall biosynthesis
VKKHSDVTRRLEHNTTAHQSNRLITVAILTYNSAKTINECLESLIAQTFKQFNVLVVDDNSTDDTMEIVLKYLKNKKLNIKILKNGSHSIPKGRNIALRSAKRGIVAFLDSDDSAQSDWLETITATYKKDPSLAMIFGKQVLTYNTYFAKAIAYNDSAARKLFIHGILLFCTCNCAVNRDVIGDYYFNENFKVAEDLEFAARVAEKYDWKYIPEMKVNHKTRDNPKEYAKQMYQYGLWKINYTYWTSSIRSIDYLPLSAAILSIAISLINPYLLLAIFLLPLGQVVISILNSDATIFDIPTMFFGWCIKNTAWSIGVVRAIPNRRKILVLKNLELQKTLIKAPKFEEV